MDVETVQKAFQAMEYNSCKESDKAVKEWLSNSKRVFTTYMNGAYTDKSASSDEVLSPSGRLLARLATYDDAKQHMETLLKASREAVPRWAKLLPFDRAQHLHSLASIMKEKQQMVATVEALETGLPIHFSKGQNVPAFIQGIRYYAGQALEPMSCWKPCGSVTITLGSRMPLLSLLDTALAALCVGNVVVIQVYPGSILTSYLFAELCDKAGIPAGVVNVCDERLMSSLSSFPLHFDHVTYVGPKRPKLLDAASCHLNISSKIAMIVYDSADLDAAVDGVLELFSHVFDGCRLFVEQTVHDDFINRLTNRTNNLSSGDALDPSVDFAVASANPEVEKLIKIAQEEGAVVKRFDVGSGPFSPALVYNVDPSSKLVVGDTPVPVVNVIPFRTAKEAISLCNNSPHGMSASVWTENMSLGMETADALQVGKIFLNRVDGYDAACSYVPHKNSGFGCMGGMRGLYEYLVPSNKKESVKGMTSCMSIRKDVIGKEYKCFINGSWKSSGIYWEVENFNDNRIIGVIPRVNEADINSAVDAASKALPNWSSAPTRRQAFLLDFAKVLGQRKDEFAEQLHSLCKWEHLTAAEEEVKQAVSSLHYWAAQCIQQGSVHFPANTKNVTVMVTPKPLGVIVMYCPEENPLLSFVTLMASCIAQGNTTVIVPSHCYPTLALDLASILQFIEFPAGVVNVLTCYDDSLSKQLSDHVKVDCIWHLGHLDMSHIQKPKYLVWASDIKATNEEYLKHIGTAWKQTWLAQGTIFAN